MPRSLAQAIVALAEGRQLEDLAQMLEKEGASVLRCPMVSILDAPDPAPVVAWLRPLIAGRFAWVVLFTGEGVRRLLGFAERDRLHQLAAGRSAVRGRRGTAAGRAVASGFGPRAGGGGRPGGGGQPAPTRGARGHLPGAGVRNEEPGAAYQARPGRGVKGEENV